MKRKKLSSLMRCWAFEGELTKQNDLLARNNAAMQGVLLALKEIAQAIRGSSLA